MRDAKAVELETAEPDFKVTPELLKKALDKYGEKVKVLVLNYPVNPTGVIYTPDEVRALADLLKNYNVAILDDEIYADLLYEGEHLPMAKLLPDQALYVNGVSKNAAMTGWRVGYNFRREDTRTCSGDESPRQSTEKVLFIWLSFPMVV